MTALLMFGLLSCGSADVKTHKSNIMDTEKQNIGSVLALYPKPMTVIGAEVNGKVNWLVVGHTGIIGHDRILVSMSKSHYTNQGIKESRKLSVNLVSREMLPKADYVGSVSGASVDKSEVFEYHWGENGTPVIDASPLTMECDVVDIYETEGFDNFVCSIVNTYAAPDVLGADGKLDYLRLKPVLFEFPTYSYLATGEIIGKCLNLDKQPGMCAKEPMTADGIVRLSKIEVWPQFLDEYIKYVTEVGEISLRAEPGVLTMYAVSEKENPCKITILETYASKEAYDKHIASAHFQKYKQGTLHMVKSLELTDQTPLNPANRINNFIEQRNNNVHQNNANMESNTIKLTIEGGKTFTATLEHNSSAKALREQLAKGDITLEMNDYGDMEKVGSLGINLPRNDRQTTTGPGDIILYLGNNLVIYYDTNSWNFTRIGKVNGVGSRKEMLELLGGAGKISVTLSLGEK